MKVIYLGSYEAHHPNFHITYQDINDKRDIGGDMMDIDLEPYDVVIATPPCNYWSRANYRRDVSNYALKTKHLLPNIINKCINLDKPFIVENVRNNKLFKENGLLNLNCFIYEHGRHTYWTNIIFNPTNIKQTPDFKAANIRLDNNKWLTPAGKLVNSNGVTRIKSNTQGGDNVHKVIEMWLQTVFEIIQAEE